MKAPRGTNSCKRPGRETEAKKQRSKIEQREQLMANRALLGRISFGRLKDKLLYTWFCLFFLKIKRILCLVDKEITLESHPTSLALISFLM